MTQPSPFSPVSSYLQYDPGIPNAQGYPFYPGYPNYMTQPYPQQVERAANYMGYYSTSLYPGQEPQCAPYAGTAQNIYQVVQPYLNNPYDPARDQAQTPFKPPLLSFTTITTPQGQEITYQFHRIPCPPSFFREIPGNHSQASQTANNLPLTTQRIEQLNKELLNAAVNNSIDRVQNLLRQKADINTKDQTDGQTPLHKALSNPHYTIMEVLLHAEADKYVCDNENNTPMARAIATGNSRAVEILLNFGYDANHIDELAERPLHYLAKRLMTHSYRHRTVSIARFLLHFGAQLSLAISAIFKDSLTEKLKDGSSKKIPNYTFIKMLRMAEFDKSVILDAVRIEKKHLTSSKEMDQNTFQEYRQVVKYLRGRAKQESFK